MFLTNATSLNLLDEAGRSVYEALNEGLYDLYFRYDKERENGRVEFSMGQFF